MSRLILATKIPRKNKQPVKVDSPGSSSQSSACCSNADFEANSSPQLGQDGCESTQTPATRCESKSASCAKNCQSVLPEKEGGLKQLSHKLFIIKVVN